MHTSNNEILLPITIHSFLDVIYGAMALYRTHTGRHPKKTPDFWSTPLDIKSTTQQMI